MIDGNRIDIIASNPSGQFYPLALFFAGAIKERLALFSLAFVESDVMTDVRHLASNNIENNYLNVKEELYCRQNSMTSVITSFSANALCCTVPAIYFEKRRGSALLFLLFLYCKFKIAASLDNTASKIMRTGSP